MQIVDKQPIRAVLYIFADAAAAVGVKRDHHQRPAVWRYSRRCAVKAFQWMPRPRVAEQLVVIHISINRCRAVPCDNADTLASVGAGVARYRPVLRNQLQRARLIEVRKPLVAQCQFRRPCRRRRVLIVANQRPEYDALPLVRQEG